MKAERQHSDGAHALAIGAREPKGGCWPVGVQIQWACMATIGVVLLEMTTLGGAASFNYTRQDQMTD